ncbi:uncharacterized protein LOC111085040 [Limulus polyphemus]|uniref:Uncharacterized protein LOC111085040 n=1 Tax=Limulus polyphemus TaxID=6850 RepID=A0ABM1S285_LIMPO|nr:uncharacterized protein LOC111085040 [Limulus polyphemus]
MHLQNPDCSQEDTSRLENMDHQKLSNGASTRHWQYPVSCEDKTTINFAEQFEYFCSNIADNASSCISSKMILSPDLPYVIKGTSCISSFDNNQESTSMDTGESQQESEQTRLFMQEGSMSSSLEREAKNNVSQNIQCFNSEEWQHGLTQEIDRLRLDVVKPDIIVWEESQDTNLERNANSWYAKEEGHFDIHVPQMNYKITQDPCLSVPNISITDEKRRPPLPDLGENSRGAFSA